MVDYHLMISRYSGLYHDTLKLLDSNNKKEVEEAKKMAFKIYILSMLIRMVRNWFYIFLLKQEQTIVDLT